MISKKYIWASWGVITIAILCFYGFTSFVADNKALLLIGKSTYGHYQIEMACTACHKTAFGGKAAIQDACVSCHKKELRDAQDSHSKKKFNDPRNSARLEAIDARICITCHTEHQLEQTREMGLTIPEDFCFHCHQKVDVKRSSHAGLGFDTCANAGCHNYHDNRALYETFFVDNASSPWLKTKAVIVPPNAAAHTAGDSLNAHPEFKSTELPLSTNANHWDDNLHIQKGIACSSCHLSSDQASEQWLTKPAIKQCQQCHLKEAKGFKLGRHGMRLPYKMAAAKPSDSRMLEFDKSMSSVEHDCVACHQKNSFGTRFAATQACLGCHKDEHSKAFPTSPHALIEASNESSHGSATVDCATCHMPRVSTSGSGNLISVEHNQSLYLRPNEKMIRPVCMACHGLAFSIDALADLNLIRNNFSGRPSRHVPSIDWALKRKASKKTKNKLQK